MTAPVAVARTEVIPFAPTANPSHPGAAVLPDDTILIAWQDLDTGTVTIHHYTPNLDPIEQATFHPGSLDSFGLALAPVDDSARLLLSTTAWDITTNPLAVTPAGGHATLYWAVGASATAAIGDATVIAASTTIAIVRPSGTTTVTAPNVVTSLTPDDGTVLVGVMRSTPEDTYLVDLHRLNPTAGTLTLVATGPAQDALTYPGVTTGQAWAAMEWDGTGERLVTRDQSGAILATPGWPDDDRIQEGYAGTAPTPAGLLAAWAHRSITTTSGGLGLAHLTHDGTVTHVDLDLTEWPAYRGVNWSFAPVLATNGTTTVLVRTGMLYGPLTGRPDEYGITAWTVDLGATYHGILHIDTLTHPYWLVGTADPDMAYRLHIDGLVEILAGQDDQATHRLRVCDGTDWPVAAYLRPE